jgi:hypothetical protein
MYLGALLLFLGTPLLLGSLYGTLMGLVLIFLLALRTLGEEDMLVNELEGYAEYKKKVKYRATPCCGPLRRGAGEGADGAGTTCRLFFLIRGLSVRPQSRSSGA